MELKILAYNKQSIMLATIAKILIIFKIIHGDPFFDSERRTREIW